MTETESVNILGGNILKKFNGNNCDEFLRPLYNYVVWEVQIR